MRTSSWVQPGLRFKVLLLAGTLLNACGERADFEGSGTAIGGSAIEAGASNVTGPDGGGVAGRVSTGGNSTGDAGGSGGLTGAGGPPSSGGAAGSIDVGGSPTAGGVASAGSAGTAGAAGGETASDLPITIWIAGDSTVKTYAAGNTDGYNGTTLEGWGQELGPFFNDKVTIDNQAIGGRSVAIFMWETIGDICVDSQGIPQFRMVNGNKVDTSRWAKIKNGMKPGDFLLVQFGHNDETHTCPRFVSVTDFATYLGFMADTAIAKGTTPIFVTPMGHRSFMGTKFNNTLLPYAQSMKAEAERKGVAVLDLNLRSGEYYEMVGNAYLAKNIFDGGTTHFIKPGAVQMASLIVGELKKQGGRLSGYLK